MGFVILFRARQDLAACCTDTTRQSFPCPETKNKTLEEIEQLWVK